MRDATARRRAANARLDDLAWQVKAGHVPLDVVVAMGATGLADAWRDAVDPEVLVHLLVVVDREAAGRAVAAILAGVLGAAGALVPRAVRRSARDFLAHAAALAGRRGVDCALGGRYRDECCDAVQAAYESDKELYDLWHLLAEGTAVLVGVWHDRARVAPSGARWDVVAAMPATAAFVARQAVRTLAGLVGFPQDVATTLVTRWIRAAVPCPTLAAVAAAAQARAA